MPILNYTTTVVPEKSITEIQKRLVSHGADRIAISYIDGRPSGLQFVINHPERGPQMFNLPVDVDAIQKVLIKHRVEKRYTTTEHATRVAWRVMKDWVAAQMVLIESAMVRLDEVMLPYLVLDHTTGRTLRQTYNVREIEA